MSIPQLLVAAGTVYLEVGLAVALLFAVYGVERLEPSARGGSILFRLLIVPGAILLWPLIVKRAAGAFARARGRS
jgi:hypothetical protein